MADPVFDGAGNGVSFQINGLPIDQDFPRRNIIQPAQAVQEGGLSASSGSHDTEKLVFSNMKGEIVQNQQISKFFGQVLDHNLVFVFHSDTSYHSAGSTTAVMVCRRRRNGRNGIARGCPVR